MSVHLQRASASKFTATQTFCSARALSTITVCKLKRALRLAGRAAQKGCGQKSIEQHVVATHSHPQLLLKLTTQQSTKSYKSWLILRQAVLSQKDGMPPPA